MVTIEGSADFKIDFFLWFHRALGSNLELNWI